MRKQSTVIAHYHDEMAAEFARAFLENEGIPTQVLNAHSHRMAPLTGLDLAVPSPEAERATALLHALEEHEALGTPVPDGARGYQGQAGKLPWVTAGFAVLTLLLDLFTQQEATILWVGFTLLTLVLLFLGSRVKADAE